MSTPDNAASCKHRRMIDILSWSNKADEENDVSMLLPDIVNSVVRKNSFIHDGNDVLSQVDVIPHVEREDCCSITSASVQSGESFNQGIINSSLTYSLSDIEVLDHHITPTEGIHHDVVETDTREVGSVTISHKPNNDVIIELDAKIVDNTGNYKMSPKEDVSFHQHQMENICEEINESCNNCIGGKPDIIIAFDEDRFEVSSNDSGNNSFSASDPDSLESTLKKDPLLYHSVPTLDKEELTAKLSQLSNFSLPSNINHILLARNDNVRQLKEDVYRKNSLEVTRSYDLDVRKHEKLPFRKHNTTPSLLVNNPLNPPDNYHSSLKTLFIKTSHYKDVPEISKTAQNKTCIPSPTRLLPPILTKTKRKFLVLPDLTKENRSVQNSLHETHNITCESTLDITLHEDNSSSDVFDSEDFMKRAGLTDENDGLELYTDNLTPSSESEITKGKPECLLDNDNENTNDNHITNEHTDYYDVNSANTLTDIVECVHTESTDLINNNNNNTIAYDANVTCIKTCDETNDKSGDITKTTERNDVANIYSHTVDVTNTNTENNSVTAECNDAGDIWDRRKEHIDKSLHWLRSELVLLRKQDKSLLWQLEKCQTTIETLKLRQWKNEPHWEDWELEEYERSYSTRYHNSWNSGHLKPKKERKPLRPWQTFIQRVPRVTNETDSEIMV